MDRQKLALRFEITPEGGRIHFGVLEPGDRQTRDAIGNYGRLLEEKLRGGEPAPLLALLPPTSAGAGAHELFRQNGGVAFSVESEAAGGVCLHFVAPNQETRARIHDFIKAAGGDATVRVGGRGAEHPGNNLGWDARRDPDLAR